MENSILTDHEESKVVAGKYLIRLVKNKEGIYEDELRLVNGKKVPSVFPYSLHRASKVEFRNMSTEETQAYHDEMKAKTGKVPYEVLVQEVESLKKQLEKKEKEFDSIVAERVKNAILEKKIKAL